MATVKVISYDDYKGVSPLKSPKQQVEDEAKKNYESATKVYKDVLNAKKQVVKQEVNKMGTEAPKLQLSFNTNPTSKFVRNENGTTTIKSPLQQNQEEIKSNTQKSRILSNNLKQNVEYQTLSALEQPLNNQRLLAKYNYDVAKEDNHNINLFDRTLGVPLRAVQDFLNIGSYNTNDYYIDENNNKMLLPQDYQIRQENVRNSYGDDIFGKIARFGTDVGYNLTKIGLSSAINTVAPFAGSAMYFTDMGVDNFNQAKLNGYDDESAAMYSVVGVASEMITEKLLGGFSKLMGGESAVSSTVNKTLSKVMKNDTLRSALSNAFSEGAEEFVQEFIENLNKNLILDKKSLGEAAKNTFTMDTLSDAMYSALVGMGSGGLMGATNVETNTNNTGVIPDVNKQGNINAEAYTSQLQNALENTTNQSKIDNINQAINYMNFNQAIGNDEVQARGMNANIKQLAPALNQMSNMLPGNGNEVVLPRASDNINANENINQTENIVNRLQYAPTSNEKVNNLYNTASQYFNNSEQTTNLMNTLSKVIKDKGYNIVFDNTNMNGINGKIETKNGEVTITLNPDSPRAFEFVAVHEITHAIETSSLKNMIMSYAKKNGEFNAALDSLKKTYGTNDVSSEVIADISGQLLGNQEFINNLSMKQPGLFKKLYNNIKAFYHKLRGWKSQDEFVTDLMNKWEYAYATQQNNLQTSLNSLQENPNYRGSHQLDNTKSITDLDINDIETKVTEANGWLSKQDTSDLNKLKKIINNPNEMVKIYRASPVNELNSGDWVTTDRSYAQNVADNNGGKVYTYEVQANQLYYPDNVKDLPSLHRLSSFQYVSDTAQNNVISKVDNEAENYAKEKGYTFRDNGNLVVSNLTNQQINELVKIYKTTGYDDVSSDYLRARLKDGEMPLMREVADRFIEKELGYKPKYDTTKITQDADGNKLTKAQIEFYKDSDVRDIRGRLIPVYHRTNAEFTEFDSKAGKQHGNKYGKGFYFSITPENYGNNTMQVYLNAKEGEFKYIPSKGYYIVQNANQIKNVTNTNPTSTSNDIRYSKNATEWSKYLDKTFNKDNEGRKLSKEQQNYFKDSKVVDNNGNLITVYHTMTDEGTQFNEFNPVGTPNYKFGNQVVNFYTNSKTMSESYADYDYKMANTKTTKLNSIQEANNYITNFNKNNNDSFQIVKDTTTKDGYMLMRGNATYQEYISKNILLRSVVDDINNIIGEKAKYQYEGYLDIKNPYIVDAKEANWDNILSGYDDIAVRYANEINTDIKNQLSELAHESKNLAEKTSNDWWEKTKELGKLKLDGINTDATVDELQKSKKGTYTEYRKLVDKAIKLKNEIAELEKLPYRYEDSYFKENVTNIMNNLNEEQNMNYSEYELYKMAINDFTDESLIDTYGTKMTTNEIIQKVLKENEHNKVKYDGVIIKKVMDYGSTMEFDDTGAAQDVYVTFNSNQFKAADNTNPTTDADIRYSKNNKTWQQYLEENYVSRGTRTYGKDIRTKQETKTKGIDHYAINQVAESVPDTPVAKGNDVLRVEPKQDNNRLSKAEMNELKTLEDVYNGGFATAKEEARLEYLENKRDGLIKYPELKQKVEFKDISKEYTKFKNDIGKFDSKLLNEAKDTVKGYRNTKTKQQWLDVAENIGLHFKGNSQQLTDYAVQSWFEAQPNNKNSLNREGKGYVKFSIDEWVNSVYKGAGVGEKTASPTTTTQVQTTPTETKQTKGNDILKYNVDKSWIYENRSKNTYFDANKNDIYANDNTKITPSEGLEAIGKNTNKTRNENVNYGKYTSKEISNMFQFSDNDNRVIALPDDVGERLATKTTLSPAEVGNLQNILDSATNTIENGNQLEITSDYNNNLYTIKATKNGDTYVIDDVTKGIKNALGSVANIKTTTNDNVESIDTKKSKIENGETIGEVINRIKTEMPKQNDIKAEYKETVKQATNKGESKFYKNATETSQFITEENRNKLSKIGDLKYYDKVSNEESLAKASKRLSDYGTAEAYRWMQQDNKTSSATDVAEGWILLKNYQDAGDYNSMVAVAKKMREMGTVAGQTIQAYNIMARLTPEGMVKYAQSELSEAYEVYAKNKSKSWVDKNASKFDLSTQEVEFIVDNMKQVQGMKDGRAKNVKLGEIQKMLTDKLPAEKGQGIKAWMRISMLFNPKTQIRNIMGNAVITPVNMVGDFFASTADRLISKKTGVRTTGTTDLKNYIKGFKKGVYESYDDFKRGINTRNIDANRFELGQGKSFNDNTKLGKALNRIDALNSFMLDAGDRGFYEGSFTNSINNQLALNNTTKVTQDMIDIATNEALSRTWQDNNNYTRFVLNTRAMLNKVNVKGYGLGDLLIPFAKTPANLTKAIVDYSPAGMVNAIIQAKNLRNNISTGTNTAIQQHQFVQTLGKATAGTLLYVAAYGLAKAGIATGQSDDDKDTRDFIKNTLGVSSYSIKIGDKSFTYDWAQPLAAPLSIMTNIANSKNNKGQALLESIVGSLDSAGSVLLEQSFVKSINDVLTDNDGIVSGLENAVLDLPTRAVPTFMKQVTDMIDGTQRQTFEYDQPLKTALNKIKAKIPGLSQTLAPSVDSMGREIQKYGGKNNVFNVFLNPANVNTSNISKEAEEIYRVYKQTGDKTIMPRVAPYYINSKGQKVILNTEQRKDYQQVAGRIIENGVNDLLSNKNYKQMTDEEKSKVIKNIVDYSYNKAKEQVLGLELTGYKSLENWLLSGGTIADYYANKEEADFSVSSPTKYTTLKNMSIDYYNYKEYQEKVNEIKKQYSGTKNANIRKQKVFEYINSLKANPNQKVLLFKMLGNYSIKNYSSSVQQYINSFNLTAKEKKEIWDSLM